LDEKRRDRKADGDFFDPDRLLFQDQLGYKIREFANSEMITKKEVAGGSLPELKRWLLNDAPRMAVAPHPEISASITALSSVINSIR